MKKQFLVLGVMLLIFFAQNLDAQLVDNGDGTITDYAKHIMWIKNANDNFTNTSRTLNEAKQYVADLNARQFAGHSDWRLPTGIDPATDPNGQTLDHQYYSNCIGSEYGYLYYTLFGACAGWGINTVCTQFAEFPNANPILQLFQNIYLSTTSSDIYWTGMMVDATHPWTFNFRDGQYAAVDVAAHIYRLRVWPVRDVTNLPPINMDIWIKDCEADNGNVSSVPNPCENSYTSPDIYIDNNNDGVIDPPAYGTVNTIKAIIRNRGQAWAVKATVTFYYIECSTDLPYPEGAHQIGQPCTLVVPANAPMPGIPLSVATTYWNIPEPPPGGHYCLFVQLSDDNDKPLDPYPGVAGDNNLASANLWYIAQRAGESVTLTFSLGSGGSSGFGLAPWPRTFILRVKSQIPKDWPWKLEGFPIEKPFGLKLGERGHASLKIQVPKEAKPHSGGYIEIVQEDVLTKKAVGGLRYNVYEDHSPPRAVERLEVKNIQGKPVLSWAPVKTEAESEFPERVSHYEVFRNGKYYKKVAMDEDASRPGMQWTDSDGAFGSLSYSLRAVDEAGNVSAKSQEAKISIPKPTEEVQGKYPLFNWLTLLLLILLLAAILAIVVKRRRT